MVLDVGVGGGATSLPLAGRASTIVGVDEQSDMLREFETAARSAGVGAETVLGRWPEVEARTTGADVVVCGHVVYNVADLTPFGRALDGHAALRVVLELTDVHPLAWMADLWKRFHGLERPSGPSVADVDALLQRGILVKNLHGWHPLLVNCLRITVGTVEENDLLLAAMSALNR